MLKLKIIEAPQVEPITLDELKDWTKIRYNEDDQLLRSIITSARVMVEEYLWRYLITQTVEWSMDSFYNIPATMRSYFSAESGVLYIPKGNLQSVVSIKYDNDLGTETTLNTSKYAVDLGDPGRVLINEIPADVTNKKLSAIRVTYVCGYGDNTAVPEPIKHAIALQAQYLYDNRHDELQAHSMLWASKILLQPFRLNSQ